MSFFKKKEKIIKDFPGKWNFTQAEIMINSHEVLFKKKFEKFFKTDDKIRRKRYAIRSS